METKPQSIRSSPVPGTLRIVGALLVSLACLAAPADARAQAESQLLLVKKGQRANGLALEYGRTAGNTDYLKELSPDCHAIIDVPVTIHQGYETVFGTGEVQKADLVRGGATVLIPGWEIGGDFRVPVFAQLTSSYTTVEKGSSTSAKHGTELADFLMGSGIQYKDFAILHAGIVQSTETVYANDLKTSEKKGEYSPFVSVLLPFLDFSLNTLGGVDYVNVQAARLGRYANIPSRQKGFEQTNNLSFGYTRLAPAGQNNVFLRASSVLGYVDAGVDLDVVEGDLRAVTAGVSWLWEWTKMFLELRADGSMYKDGRVTERAQMFGSLSANEAAERTDPIMGGRAGVHFGLKRDYLFGPRDLNWYDRFVPSRGAFEMSYNDKEVLQGFHEAYNHATAFGKAVWDIEPANPPHLASPAESPPPPPPPPPPALPPPHAPVNPYLPPQDGR
ncbi:MAG: hypothetical protein HY897_14700 [Deltaproteobacteria bacterium]|nr:hypothetical protein [Deltaproteobacteria bacterium]